MTTTKKGERIDRLAREAANTRLNGDQLTNLYVEMASCAYFMATEVADLYRTHAIAEETRKTYHAHEILKLQAEDAKLTGAKAERIVEGREEYTGLRSAEIIADAEYQAWKMKLDASRNVMQSLQMRLAHLRDEAKRTQSMQVT